MSQGDEVEQTTHSFVLKIWREEAPRANRGATWRGQITHVPGGERSSVRRLSQVVSFIAPYLEQLGVRLSLSWRVRRWMQRRRRPPRR